MAGSDQGDLQGDQTTTASETAGPELEAFTRARDQIGCIAYRSHTTGYTIRRAIRASPSNTRASWATSADHYCTWWEAATNTATH